ncbi:MAG: alpha/beta fold hydrolase [Nitrososphaeraceae archaeon]
MSSHTLIRKDHIILIVVISGLVITSSSISNHGYFGFTKVVYGQSNPDQMDSNTTNSVNIHDAPLEKVHVGDIDIAYKMFGKGDPIILFNGASDGMDAWDPSFLAGLSSNHTVIAFDQRGIGNTTAGSQPYTQQQLANDTAGLLDALKIPKADVLGYSLGSYLSQQLTILYPDKVNSLVLVGSSCGGKDHTPKPPEFIKLQSDVVNKSLNNIPITPEEIKSLNSASLGSGWVKLHPVITGTDDDKYQPYVNSLKIVEKIPGAWLVQIKDAGHAIMNQYPAEISNILNTFLSTTSPNN